MSKKSDAIRRLRDGRREVGYRSGVPDGGTPVYGKTHCEKRLVLSEKRLTAAARSPLSFEDVQQLWWAQNSIHFKASTERKYTYLLQSHILPEIGNCKITQITAPMINLMLTNKLKSGRLDGTGGLAPAYVRSIMLIINSIMQFAVAERYCAPLSSRINKPTLVAKEAVVLDPQQRIKMEAAISINPSATETGILIAMYTGLRIGEICALSWNDIDFSNKLITVRHTVSRIDAISESDLKSQWVLTSPKTPASLRVIPICTKLLAVLSEYRKRSPSYFIVSTKDTFVSPRTFEYRFHAVLKKHGIEDINFHALRHEFATRCVERSVDVKSLSEILGHASESITLKTYVHSSLESKRLQMERIG